MPANLCPDMHVMYNLNIFMQNSNYSSFDRIKGQRVRIYLPESEYVQDKILTCPGKVTILGPQPWVNKGHAVFGMRRPQK